MSSPNPPCDDCPSFPSLVGQATVQQDIGAGKIQNGKITDYEGTVTVTVSSWDCQKWPLQTPHKHKHDYDNLGDHNFGRNLKGSHIGVWCYASDPEKQWENCLEARWLCIKPAFRQSQVILETPPSPYMMRSHKKQTTEFWRQRINMWSILAVTSPNSAHIAFVICPTRW